MCNLDFVNLHSTLKCTEVYNNHQVQNVQMEGQFF